MAKHSHWHNIRHKKEKEDKKKSKLYSKHSKNIIKAAREGGGDPEKNVALKRAIDQAKDDDVPKENIQRAIKRGTGELLDEGEMEDIIYEGYGPEGVAILVDATTDNRNRTSSDLKYVFSDYGGSLGESGSVKWQFNYLAVIEFDKKQIEDIDWEQLQLKFMEAGAEEIMGVEEIKKIRADKDDYNSLLEVIQKYEIETKQEGLKWVPKETISVKEETEEKVENMIEDLKDLRDVDEVFTNLE
ncbi:MAG: YebC/PmpR family DNA-binding transcriptional regulator [Parcubacteria group bacterium QH_9_35_7]|nr:MAG: YebC/PmpR family DNA-binding transcriptional regulator [Parcubacteria group bacterium QH_9_35_7]